MPAARIETVNAPRCFREQESIMNPVPDVELMLIEGNPYDAELTMHTLKRRRITSRILWAKDGEEAAQHLFGSQALPTNPKLILLDLKLAKLDGLALIRRIRSTPQTRQIPIAVLTYAGEPSDMARCYELGVNSYIVKPMSFELYSDVVSQIGAYWLLTNQSVRTSPQRLLLAASLPM